VQTQDERLAVARETPVGVVGVVEGLFTAEAAGAPMIAHETVQVIVGAGLVGDRYAAGSGTYSQVPGGNRELTLIAAEALEMIAREFDVPLTQAQCRRNIITRGVNLDALYGKRFRIGAVECYGARECPPCGYIERLTGIAGLNRALSGRGGLRVDILSAGEIAVGDTIYDVRDALSTNAAPRVAPVLLS